MAQIKLARGQEKKILQSKGDNGKLYVATDTNRLFSDIKDPNTPSGKIKRVEINPGTVETVNFTLDYDREAGIMGSDIVGVHIKTNINLEDESTMIMITGVPKDGENRYYTDGVYFGGFEWDKEVGQWVLRFGRPTTVGGSYDYTAKVFIYSGALSPMRYIEVDDIDYTNAAINYSISPVDWVQSEENNTYTVNIPTITSEDDIFITSINDNMQYQSLNDASITENGLVITSNVLPSSNIDICVQQLPEDVRILDNFKLLAKDWQEDNTQTIYANNIYTDSIIMIECVENEEEYKNILSAEIVDDEKIVFTKKDVEIIGDISFKIIDLTNKVNLYNITLKADNWENVSDTNYCYCTIELDTALTCGDQGEAAPIIYSVDNVEGFNLIQKITVSEGKQAITCLGSQSILSFGDINLTILDYK